MGNIGITATGNIIANLKASSTGAMAVNGIYCNGAGVNNFSNNIIRDIKSDGTRVITTQGIDAGLIGLVLNSNSSGNTISGNTIYNLENNNSTVATDVYGINNHTISATTVTSIEANKIYNLKTASTNTAANVVGISITRGLTKTVNNMISLGDGISNAVAIVGIRKLGTAVTQNNNFFHNTVSITGSEVGAAGTSYTAAFAKVYSATDQVKNNIFINKRSNATGNNQKHYALFVNDLTTFTSDYNVMKSPGTGGLIAANGATDYPTLGEWQTGSSKVLNSKESGVNFVNAVAGDLRLTGDSEHDDHLAVPILAEVSVDFFGTSRAATPPYTYAGAHQSVMLFYWTSIEFPSSSHRILNTYEGIAIELTNEATIELYNVNGILIDKTRTSGVYKKKP